MYFGVATLACLICISRARRHYSVAELSQVIGEREIQNIAHYRSGFALSGDHPKLKEIFNSKSEVAKGKRGRVFCGDSTHAECARLLKQTQPSGSLANLLLTLKPIAITSIVSSTPRHHSARMETLDPLLTATDSAMTADIVPSSTPSDLSPETIDLDVVKDTLAEIGYFVVFFGVVGLTIYSLVVSLQSQYKETGGWGPQKTNYDPVTQKQKRVYDPVTEKWTEVAPEPSQFTPEPSQPTSEGNRYERRVRKKRGNNKT